MSGANCMIDEMFGELSEWGISKGKFLGTNCPVDKMFGE